jgi:hypothetical protein
LSFRPVIGRNNGLPPISPSYIVLQLSNKVELLTRMAARARHSGMFLAGIQGIWRLDLTNRMTELLNNYLSLNFFKKG